MYINIQHNRVGRSVSLIVSDRICTCDVRALTRTMPSVHTKLNCKASQVA